MPATRARTAASRSRQALKDKVRNNDSGTCLSAKDALRLPRVDELVIRTTDGEEKERLEDKDCVFVVHHGMQAGKKQRDGHRYWKMKIQSIHQGEGTFWVVGTWFYSPSDLEGLGLRRRDLDLIPLMGNTELVKSDHVGVIDAACIEAKVNIHHFDDRSVTNSHIPTSTWFIRLRLSISGGRPKLGNINLHCVCQKMYSPVLDRQRWCTGCQEWFDEACMQKIGIPKRVKEWTAGECLKGVPILRGWDGLQEAEDWMTVGSGRKLEAVRNMEKKVEACSEEEWLEWAETNLSEEFVQYARRTKFIRYLCPRCQQHI